MCYCVLHLHATVNFNHVYGVYYFGVDDEKVLRQLAAQIESGKLKMSELKSLDLDSRGRGKRRKYKPEMTDEEDGKDTNNEVCGICVLFAEFY